MFRKGLLLFAGLLVGVLAGCGSPNRGHWNGTFEGSVSGSMEFDISAYGDKLKGSLSGSTRDGQPFEAKLAGRVKGEHFFAEIEGMSRAGALPVAFEGLMKGSLAEGQGEGDWSCTLRFNQVRLKGRWEARQESR